MRDDLFTNESITNDDKDDQEEQSFDPKENLHESKDIENNDDEYVDCISDNNLVIVTSVDIESNSASDEATESAYNVIEIDENSTDSFDDSNLAILEKNVHCQGSDDNSNLPESVVDVNLYESVEVNVDLCASKIFVIDTDHGMQQVVEANVDSNEKETLKDDVDSNLLDSIKVNIDSNQSNIGITMNLEELAQVDDNKNDPSLQEPAQAHIDSNEQELNITLAAKNDLADEINESYNENNESCKEVDKPYVDVKVSYNEINVSHNEADKVCNEINDLKNEANESHNEIDESDKEIMETHNEVEGLHVEINESYYKIDESHYEINESHNEADESDNEVDESFKEADEPHIESIELQSEINESYNQNDESNDESNEPRLETTEKSHSKTSLKYSKLETPVAIKLMENDTFEPSHHDVSEIKWVETSFEVDHEEQVVFANKDECFNQEREVYRDNHEEMDNVCAKKSESFQIDFSPPKRHRKQKPFLQIEPAKSLEIESAMNHQPEPKKNHEQTENKKSQPDRKPTRSTKFYCDNSMFDQDDDDDDEIQIAGIEGLNDGPKVDDIKSEGSKLNEVKVDDIKFDKKLNMKPKANDIKPDKKLNLKSSPNKKNPTNSPNNKIPSSSTTKQQSPAKESKIPILHQRNTRKIRFSKDITTHYI